MFLTKGVSCENHLIESISEITRQSDSIIEICHLNYSPILEVGIVCVITCFDIQERFLDQLNDTLIHLVQFLKLSQVLFLATYYVEQSQDSANYVGTM